MPVFQKVLELKARHGDNEGSIASIYVQLGSKSDYLGNYGEALHCYEEARRCQVRSLSTGHASVAMTKGNMGYVYLQLGQSSQARTLFEL